MTSGGRLLQGRHYQGGSAQGRFSPDKLILNLAVPEWLPLPRLIEENTPLPVFRPFLNSAECDRAIKRLTRSQKWGTITRTQAPSPRYCPECRATEFEDVAEAGWLVLHQFRWFWRCQTHRCALWQLPLRPGVDEAARPVDTGCRHRTDFQTLKAIERDTKWLMGAQVPPLGRLRWREFHRAALTTRFGIQPPYAGRPLYQLAHKIPPCARAWLQLSMISHLDNWLLTVVREGHGTADPLLHLATLRICGVRVQEAVCFLLGQIPP